MWVQEGHRDKEFLYAGGRTITVFPRFCWPCWQPQGPDDWESPEVPPGLSKEAGKASWRLLGLPPQLLQFDPTRRLGAGGDGINKLKSHPFFSTTQWSKLVG